MMSEPMGREETSWQKVLNRPPGNGRKAGRRGALLKGTCGRTCRQRGPSCAAARRRASCDGRAGRRGFPRSNGAAEASSFPFPSVGRSVGLGAYSGSELWLVVFVVVDLQCIKGRLITHIEVLLEDTLVELSSGVW